MTNPVQESPRSIVFRGGILLSMVWPHEFFSFVPSYLQSYGYFCAVGSPFESKLYEITHIISAWMTFFVCNYGSMHLLVYTSLRMYKLQVLLTVLCTLLHLQQYRVTCPVSVMSLRSDCITICVCGKHDR